MTLKELRTKLVQLTGRFDLVVNTTDYVDNGANFYINAGQRWLDRKAASRLTMSSAVVVADIDDISVVFPSARSVQQVFISDLTSAGRTQLERKEFSWLREEYYASTTVTSGTPLYYVPTFMTEKIIKPTAGVLATYVGFKDVTQPVGQMDEYYDGILFGPPCDVATLFEIWGRFYTPNFSADSETSPWSVLHPEALIMSACRMIEVFNRNTEGVKDWERNIIEQLADLDKDLAEEELADGLDSMEMELEE